MRKLHDGGFNCACGFSISVNFFAYTISTGEWCGVIHIKHAPNLVKQDAPTVENSLYYGVDVDTQWVVDSTVDMLIKATAGRQCGIPTDAELEVW